METTVSFGEDDLGLVKEDMTLEVKTMDGTVVDTTGWTMTESQRGTYKVVVPGAVVESSLYIYETIDPTVFYDGLLSPEGEVTSAEVDALTLAIGSLVTVTYTGGTISIPYNVSPGDGMVFFNRTDYDSIIFNVGTQWMSYLSAPDTVAWYTIKTGAIPNRVILDAQAVISDPTNGVITLNLSNTQTSIKEGTYFWQLRLIQTITTQPPGNPAPPPVVTYKKRMLMEGKVYIKAAFKEL